MLDSSPPKRDLLESDLLGPLAYAVEVLVRHPDGSWFDGYFGIELFDPGGVGESVVPDVVGLRYEEAERLVRETGLPVEVRLISAALPEGEVIRTDPYAGWIVFPDTVVRIQVSSGAEGG